MIDVKNALLITFVLAIAAIVGLYIPYVQYTERQSSIAPISAVDGPSVHVVYTNRGFEPAIITIDIGTTVEWINESDKPMWVASDPHPSHTNLPGFDERGIEGSNPVQGLLFVAYAHSGAAIYRYTFSKAGSWNYHNHLTPSDRGTVIVK